jgi:soluble lytic murein transglycosylase-like protein
VTDSEARATTPASPARRLRLQALLVAVLAVWFVDSGLPALSEIGAAERPEDSTAPASAEIDLEAEADALAALLRRVNPSLDATQVERIANAVLRYSAKYELDPELVTAVLLVESSARPWARSPKGAVGLMQVMPHMMEPLQLAGNAATIEANIEAGCWILASNIRRLGEEAGISTYFWGSDIRGLAYLEKVRAAREEVRRHWAS